MLYIFIYHLKCLFIFEMIDFKNRSIISISDFSKEELLFILDKAKSLEENPQQLMHGKVLATLFFEPSTRTRLSFESSMLRLGGKVLGFADPNVSSAKKGETVHDTVRTVEGYCDVIVMRHHIEGAARLASECVSIPVINAGDGANQHPTQTCLDLYTIRKSKGTLNNLNIGFLGDLKYGRTVHSLVKAMSLFDNVKMTFIAPDALKMPKSYLRDLDKKGIQYVEEPDLMKVVGGLDILYATRIQKERFPDPMEYEKVKGVYKLDKELLKHTKPSLKIMHPLPRVDEINKNLDPFEHSIYFEQAHNGIPIRQALLALVTGTLQ